MIDNKHLNDFRGTSQWISLEKAIKQATNNPLTICVANTQYKSVRQVSKEDMEWTGTNDTSIEKWDVMWQDFRINQLTLSKMYSYQRINHFMGMKCICSKGSLAINLSKLQEKFPKEYKFFPKS